MSRITFKDATQILVENMSIKFESSYKFAFGLSQIKLVESELLVGFSSQS